MFNKRLLGLIPSTHIHIVKNIIFQVLGLISNIVFMAIMAQLIQQLVLENQSINYIYILIAIVCIIVRFVMNRMAQIESLRSSQTVKSHLRSLIYDRMMILNRGLSSVLSESALTQVSSEGVEQLEIYFGQYIPQFFYSLIASLVVFGLLFFIEPTSAIVLLICVPLIPMAIMLVAKWAKKLLSKYWNQYTGLGDSFLDNLNGLTTLKIYQADNRASEAMAKESEAFRKITMKVLTMQLNSISIMDFVAYGGASVALIIALHQYMFGSISLAMMIFIICIGADYFIPLRTLGSFFHVAMNGMAASEKIFKLIDATPHAEGNLECEPLTTVMIDHLNYRYENGDFGLNDISLSVHKHQLIALVGESGCGKSTLAQLIASRFTTQSSAIKLNDHLLDEYSLQSLHKQIYYLPSSSILFKGSIRDNLLYANPNASDHELMDVLTKVNLKEYLDENNGLDTVLDENGTNLSGGQRQRLAFAKALLSNASLYIFDESTSNIDVESETLLLDLMKEIAKDKMVLMIAHRLANVIEADHIYVMDHGSIIEDGTHQDLMNKKSIYYTMFTTQQGVEHYEE